MLFNAAIIIAFIAIFFYQLKKCPIDPVEWTDPTPLASLEGKLAPNNLLQHIQDIDGDFAGPEALAFNNVAGTVYGSFNDGTVGEFDDEGKLLRRVFFTAGFLRQTNKTNGLDGSSAELQKYCNKEALSKRLSANVTGERTCGRPLGLRLRRDSTLYILDAYHGLFELDLTTLKATHLVTPTTPISVPAIPTPRNIDPHVYLPLIFFNDLDIFEEDDLLIFSDSSYAYTRSENRKDVVEGGPKGRLFQYNLRTKELCVLLCGLHFPNGIQIFPTKNSQNASTSSKEILIAETTRFRVLQVNISAPFFRNALSLPAAGTSAAAYKTAPSSSSSFHHVSSCAEHGSLYQAIHSNDYTSTGIKVFASSLPGNPDNIRYVPPTHHHSHSKDEGYFLIPYFTKSVKPFSLMWFGYQHPWMGRILCSLIPMSVLEYLVPRYGLVTAYDVHGQAKYSLHDPTGHQYSFSHAAIHPKTGDVWFGSHSESGIRILPKQYIPTH